MKPRLVVCLCLSALLGVGAAAYCVIGGLGVVIAILAYSGTASVSLLALALVTMPREPKADRSVIAPAPFHHHLIFKGHSG